MNKIEKLENAISTILANIEENEEIDQPTKEKLINNISNLYDITGEMKEENENNYAKLREVMNSL